MTLSEKPRRRRRCYAASRRIDSPKEFIESRGDRQREGGRERDEEKQDSKCQIRAAIAVFHLPRRQKYKREVTAHADKYD